MSLHARAIPNAAGHKDVVPAQVFADHGKTRIVDVREPHEFTGDLGHIEGAELVPLATVGHASAAWPRDTPIVLICRSGRRSEQAAQALMAAGFRDVMNMVGGMLAWSKEGLPVVSASA